MCSTNIDDSLVVVGWGSGDMFVVFCVFAGETLTVHVVVSESQQRQQQQQQQLN